MSVYCLVDLSVHNPTEMAAYSAKVGDLVRQFGGRYLARTREITPLEGDWRPSFIAILEFEDAQAFERFHASPDYAPLRAIRQAAATTRSVMVEGVQ
jgi:uncharacterized protein (DUF1330 family)